MIFAAWLQNEGNLVANDFRGPRSYVVHYVSFLLEVISDIYDTGLLWEAGRMILKIAPLPEGRGGCWCRQGRKDTVVESHRSAVIVLSEMLL